MYFVKARKHFEEQEVSKTPEKSRRDRYQRSDSARLVLQALPQGKLHQIEDGKLPKPTPASTESSPSAHVTSVVDSSETDFKPDELPDGACYRPKKDLKNLPVSAASSQDVVSIDKEHMEHVRPAEVSLLSRL